MFKIKCSKQKRPWLCDTSLLIVMLDVSTCSHVLLHMKHFNESTTCVAFTVFLQLIPRPRLVPQFGTIQIQTTFKR